LRQSFLPQCHKGTKLLLELIAENIGLI